MSRPLHPRNFQWRGWKLSPQMGQGGAGEPFPRAGVGQLPGLNCWGILAQVHQHLICMAIHPPLHSQPPQKPLPALEKGTGPRSPFQCLPHCPSPEGRTMV